MARMSKVFFKAVCVIMGALVFAGNAAASVEVEVSKIPERADIEETYKWDLGKIYPSVAAWEESFASVSPRIKALAEYHGKLGDPEELLRFLREEEAVSKELWQLYVYAGMRRDQDTRESKFQALADRADGLLTLYMTSVSFFRPEILSLPGGALEKFMEQNEALRLYRFYFSELLRGKKYVLSQREEELLGLANEIGAAAEKTHSILTNAELMFPTIGVAGQEMELTEENFQTLLRNRSSETRKAAFEGIFGTYKRFIKTIGALYAGAVKNDIFISKARGYESSLTRALFSDNVPEAVYENVVGVASDNLDTLHDYMRLRARALDVEKIKIYDLTVPLSEEEPLNYIPYEQAINMVTEALAPLGSEYASTLKRAFSERWIDVYENQGKLKGAYSWGSYGTQPYVLLNYNGTLRDVFTIAHEIGHAMHSFYAQKTQPQVYADYSIFLAEVASTTNEALLLEYLLRKSESKPEAERLAEKKWLLVYYFDMVRVTLYRQAMFSVFEKQIFSWAEAGEALTSDKLSALWGELVKKYHGPAVEVDELINVEWARIPHFFKTPFYVWKYVSGFVAAGSLAQAILNEGEPAAARYIEFLKSGASDIPLDILAKAGVDLKGREPFDQTIGLFKARLQEAEKIF